MTAPANRTSSAPRSAAKAAPAPVQAAVGPDLGRLAAKLDRLVFAAAPPRQFGLG